MHILLLSSGKVVGLPVGGEDKHTILLGKWLANQGHDVTLIGIEYAGLRTTRFPAHWKKYQGNHINIGKKKRRIDPRRPHYFSYSLRTIIWLFQVLKILLIHLKTPITLIHAQDSGYTGLASVVVAKMLNIPILITLHGIRTKEIECNPFINTLIKKIILRTEYVLDLITLTKADLITIVSPLMRNYIEESGSENRVFFIPNAVRVRNFEFSQTGRDQIRNELGIAMKDKVIGYVGRLSPEKNLLMLLKAFASAVKDDSSLKLVLVGEGLLENELVCLARDLSVRDKVIFCGYRDEIAVILSGFDLFVLPSCIEGFSIALLEAMACSRAIVCSNIPQNCQLVTHNQDGLLVDPENQEDIKSAILLLSNDEEFRQKLGQSAKNKISQYDEDVIFSQFLEQYEILFRRNKK